MAKARNFAICIGIDRYRFLQPLRCARRDARAMATFFREEADFEQIWLLCDDAKNDRTKPDRANIRRVLRELRQRKMGAGDNLWFFFSGHGMRHGGRDYLMPLEGDREDVESTALLTSYVADMLRECGADNVILFLDACRNQADKGGEGIGKETEEKARQTGVVTLFSCSPNEYSYELESLQQGAFTRAVLDGLGIQGQCATVARLDRYLQHRVPELLQQYRGEGYRQKPYVIAEPILKSHLILLPRYARPEDIDRLKLEAYKAETSENLELARQLWIRINAAAMGTDLEPFEAISRITLKLAGFPASMPPKPQPSASAKSAKSLPRFNFEVVTLNRQGEVVRREQQSANYFSENLGNGVTLEMVEIPGGTFVMGAPEDEEGTYDDERPQHNVTVPSFFMGKYPVTQAQWRAVASMPKSDRDIDSDPSHFKGNDNRPVEQVSWLDAQEFCKRLSNATGREYRLPSEAEWEYACRAGTTTPFYFGETISTDVANYCGQDYEVEGKTYSGSYGQGVKGEYRKQTTDVGSFPPNRFGLYDMHGNVWEWCEDDWHDNYNGAPNDGSAWIENDNRTETEKVLRGGSWYFDPRNCRSAYRYRYGPGFVDVIIGFRVACGVARTLS
ncbi:serine/threonine kinase [Geitlerinema sp. FC II]|nr:serine/threonine kinase [Geitlerinema sp. FC II]